jgi:hypothetical protein
MIICNSHNFAVTRAQKTGGASIEMYILESGLIDHTNDIYTLEGGFTTWEEFLAYSNAHDNLKYSELPRELYGTKKLAAAQKTFAELVADGQVSSGMPCIGGIRHPLEWLASLYYYANVRRKITRQHNIDTYGEPSIQDKINEETMSEPDASWDLVFKSEIKNPAVQKVLKPQTDYYPDHATLFNIENIHEHVSEFIVSKGGQAPTQRIEIRKSENDPTYYLENLSDYRKQLTLELYEKDFIAWEKAYAKFN